MKKILFSVRASKRNCIYLGLCSHLVVSIHQDGVDGISSAGMG